jgi:hypothetical protein
MTFKIRVNTVSTDSRICVKCGTCLLGGGGDMWL